MNTFALQLMNIVGDSSQEKIGQPMKTLGFVETKKNAVSYYLCQSDAAAASGLDSRSFQNVVNYDLPKKCVEEYVHQIGRLERLDSCMDKVYNQFSCPQVLLPVALNSVCVAPCDYGGYRSIVANELRQIRTEFLSFPFQAIECYLANWSEKEVNKKIYRTGAGHPKKGKKRTGGRKKMGIRLR